MEIENHTHDLCLKMSIQYVCTSCESTVIFLDPLNIEPSIWELFLKKIYLVTAGCKYVNHVMNTNKIHMIQNVWRSFYVYFFFDLV
jgi:hypothetical protein